MRKNSIQSDLLVGFYRFWHGKLHLKGAGVLLRSFMHIFPELERYKLSVPRLGTLTVNLNDYSGGAWLNYALGESSVEDGLIRCIKDLSLHNPVIWDVGANGGFVMTELALRLDNYKAFRMFEPNPELIPLLHEVASFLRDTVVHHCALSNTGGSLTLYVLQGHSSLASSKPCRNATPVTVKCITVDQFLCDTGADDPDVVVIDTEGNDARVVNGMKGLIERKRPIVIIEHIFLTDEEVEKTIPEGYSHFTIDDVSGNLIIGLERRKGHNSIFLPQEYNQNLPG